MHKAWFIFRETAPCNHIKVPPSMWKSCYGYDTKVKLCKRTFCKWSATLATKLSFFHEIFFFYYFQIDHRVDKVKLLHQWEWYHYDCGPTETDILGPTSFRVLTIRRHFERVINRYKQKAFLSVGVAQRSTRYISEHHIYRYIMLYMLI